MTEDRHRRSLTWTSCVLTLVLAAILCACGVLAWGAVGCGLLSGSPDSLFGSHPSDQELIDNYGQHRDEFNLLARMLLNETYILIVFPDGEGKCQVEGRKLMLASEDTRCQQYVSLFRLLDLDWAYAGRDPLWLPVSQSGLGVSGSSKGYVYSTKQPDELVDDTDASRPYDGMVFRHIEGNWYIFYEST